MAIQLMAFVTDAVQLKVGSCGSCLVSRMLSSWLRRLRFERRLRSNLLLASLADRGFQSESPAKNNSSVHGTVHGTVLAPVCRRRPSPFIFRPLVIETIEVSLGPHGDMAAGRVYPRVGTLRETFGPGMR